MDLSLRATGADQEVLLGVTGISCAMDGFQDHLCHSDSTLASVHQEIKEYVQLTEAVDEVQLDLISDDED